MRVCNDRVSFERHDIFATRRAVPRGTLICVAEDIDGPGLVLVPHVA